ncbi:MAG: DUF2145 domain-containing protein [Stenotrophomonas sp.]|uniref:DUF2145 domain-containing protein n=1 Tax=Stenotrophomonas sp. TaxID=69392 RepID=UPI0028A75E80|nr:DUF2145 domain-containing protein [Stenotrophomonas sp.]
MKPRTLFSLATALALVTLTAPAFAQEACSPRYPPPTTIAAMFDMAAVTADTLNALPDVDVAIAARGGQDLSKYGLRHSHLAFLVRNDSGSWDVVHLLNRCKTDNSDLFREGLVNLVGESSITTDLRVGIPTPAVRAALKTLLSGDAPSARALHEPRYSMLAYPGSTEYQNSNQWILEVTAAAMAQAAGEPALADRSSALAWLKQKSYAPTRMHIGIGKRLGARFFADNVAVTDHPASERISGNYSVVTVESVFDFLHRSGALERELSVAHQTPVPAMTGTPSPVQRQESTP